MSEGVAKQFFEKVPTTVLFFVVISGLTIFYLTPIKSIIGVPETLWNFFGLTPSGNVLPIQDILGRMVVVLILSVMLGLPAYYLVKPLNSMNHTLKIYVLCLFRRKATETPPSENIKIEPSEEPKFSEFIHKFRAVGNYLRSLDLERQVFTGFLFGCELSTAINLVLLASPFIQLIDHFIPVFGPTTAFISRFYFNFVFLFLWSLILFTICWVYNHYYFRKFLELRWEGILRMFKDYKET